jgi:hypothetical protein
MGDYCANGGTSGSAGSGSFDGPVVPVNGYAGYTGSPVKILGCTNGTSNILLISEKCMDTNYLNNPNSRPSNDDQGWTDGWDEDVIAFAEGGGSSSMPPSRNSPNNGAGFNFGSAHPASVQAVLCDGSVRSVSYNANPTAWVIFCQRSSGEVLDTSSF